MNPHSGYTSYRRVWTVKVMVELVELKGYCKLLCSEMAAWTRARNVGVEGAEEAVISGKQNLCLELKIVNRKIHRRLLPDQLELAKVDSDLT